MREVWKNAKRRTSSHQLSREDKERRKQNL
jgi:hypothetical protein